MPQPLRRRGRINKIVKTIKKNRFAENLQTGHFMLYCTCKNAIAELRLKNQPCCSFIFAKHSLQYTGRPSVGWNGTLHGAPQFAHTASYI